MLTGRTGPGQQPHARRWNYACEANSLRNSVKGALSGQEFLPGVVEILKGNFAVCDRNYPIGEKRVSDSFAYFETLHPT